MKKKNTKHKIGKGLVSLSAVVVLLASILAGSFYYQENITANVISETSFVNEEVPVQEVESINKLNQLNEGWYRIIKGYVFYLEDFDTLIPLHIKIKDSENLNGLLVINSDGKIAFDQNQWTLPDKQDYGNKIQTSENLITGFATGLEGITGMQAAQINVCQPTLYSANPTTPTDRSKIWTWVETSTDCQYTSSGPVPLAGRVMTATYDMGKLTYTSATLPTTLPTGDANTYDFSDAAFRTAQSLDEFTQIYTVPVYTLAQQLDVHPKDVNQEVANAWYSNKGNFVIKDNKIYRQEVVGQLIKVTLINYQDGTETQDVRVMGKEEFATFQTRPATTTAPQVPELRIIVQVQGREERISLDDAKLILGKDITSLPTSIPDLEAIFNAVSQGRFARSDGVTRYTTPDNQIRVVIQSGARTELGGVTFRAPQGTTLRVNHLGGNQYELDGKRYVYDNEKLYALDKETTGQYSGQNKIIDPKTNAVEYKVLGFNPLTKVRTAAGLQAAVGARAGANVLALELPDGQNIQFSTQGMTSDEIRNILAQIERAKEIDPATNAQKGTIFASSDRIEVEIEGKKTTYTKTSIVVTQDGKKTQEITYQTGKGNARIQVVTNFDPETQNPSSIFIGKGNVRIGADILFSVEDFKLEDIDWKNYDGSSTIPLKGNRKVEIKNNEEADFYANDKKTKTVKNIISNFQKIGQEVTDYEADGRSPKTTTRTEEIQREGVTETRKTVVQYKNGRAESTLIEGTITQENQEPIKFNIEAKGANFDTSRNIIIGDDNKVTIGGNTITGKQFKQLSNSQTIEGTKPDDLASINTLLSEAKSFGIDLSTAKATYLPTTRVVAPPVISNILVANVPISMVTSVTKDRNGLTTIIASDRIYILPQSYSYSRETGDIIGPEATFVSSTNGIYVIPNANVDSVSIRNGITTIKMKDGTEIELPKGSQYEKPAAPQAPTPGRTLTSSDGLKSLTQKDDGTIIADSLLAPGIFRSRTAKNPSTGTTTHTNCKTAQGCKEVNGQIVGDIDSIEYNEKDKTISKTFSNTKGFDVEVQYANPTDIGKNPYITRISIPTSNVNRLKQGLELDSPDDKGYQNIRGTNKYYKNGEIYIKDGSGNYVRSKDSEDTRLEGEIRAAGVEEQRKSADSKRNQMLKAERTARRQERVQTFFMRVDQIFTEFRGLGYYASFFIDEEDLLKWRQDVDEIFSKLYLGTEYWTSRICTEYANLDVQNEGVAYAETPQGLAQIGAHIEATRTEPITNEKGETTYIYKITFQVRNGDFEKDMRAPENMSINVFIGNNLIEQGPQAGIKIFKKNINIGRGSSFGRFGTATAEKSGPAIVKESKNLHTEICITFDKVPSKWKIKNNRLCNKIAVAPGEPTQLTLGRPTPQGTDADLNDF